MLQTFGAGFVFLTLAIIAALFGFGVVSDDDPLAAKLCAGFFLLTAIAAFGWAWLNRSRKGTGPAPRRFSVRPDDQRITAAKPAVRKWCAPKRTMTWSYRPSTTGRVRAVQH